MTSEFFLLPVWKGEAKVPDYYVPEILASRGNLAQLPIKGVYLHLLGRFCELLVILATFFFLQMTQELIRILHNNILFDDTAVSGADLPN